MTLKVNEMPVPNGRLIGHRIDLASAITTDFEGCRAQRTRILTERTCDGSLGCKVQSLPSEVYSTSSDGSPRLP